MREFCSIDSVEDFLEVDGEFAHGGVFEKVHGAAWHRVHGEVFTGGIAPAESWIVENSGAVRFAGGDKVYNPAAKGFQTVAAARELIATADFFDGFDDGPQASGDQGRPGEALHSAAAHSRQDADVCAQVGQHGAIGGAGDGGGLAQIALPMARDLGIAGGGNLKQGQQRDVLAAGEKLPGYFESEYATVAMAAKDVRSMRPQGEDGVDRSAACCSTV